MASPDLSYLDIRQGPNDAPHKPVLLLALMRAMELGLVTENKFLITDELLRLFYSYWKELVRSNHMAKFYLPFYHLANDGSGIWQVQKLPGFDANALTSSNSIKSLGTLRTYVAYGRLRDDVFLKWMDPVHRELARKQLLNRHFPLPVGETPEERSAWSPEEIQPTIEAYFDMVAKELADEKVVKTQVYRSLEDEGQRTAKSYEFKMQNISAVLALNDLPFLRGLVPAKNFQHSLEPQVLAYLDQYPAIRSQLLEYGKLRNRQPKLTDLIDTPSLVQEPAPTYPASPEQERTFKAVKVDFAAREHACRRLGIDGEQAVVAYEKELLTQAGRPDLAAEVEWVAQTEGDGLGYDIRSFTANYEERFIEVKTSNFDRDTPFLITDNEVAFSRENPDQYLLYRLFDFARSPKFYALDGSIEEACVLAPVRYRAWAR
ncbi:MAG: DUF3883 domain-containing protein [Flavobacteriales bacterium]